MRRALLLAAVALAVASTAHAQSNPTTLSWHRFSAGVDARGALEQPGQNTEFRGGAYASYSLTSAFSIASFGERGFQSDRTIGSLGVRFFLAQLGAGKLAAGANWVGENGVRPEWSASLHGSWPVASKRSGATAVWGVVSAETIPERDLQVYRLGLRYQLIGGAPWAIPAQPE